VPAAVRQVAPLGSGGSARAPETRAGGLSWLRVVRVLPRFRPLW